MINTDNVLEKGAYNHPQPSGYVVAQNYLVVRENGKRYLLIRFANESNLTITDFDFVLTQLDANGRVICNSKISYNGIYLPSEKTLSTSRGICVKEECVDFYIRVVSFFSGSYRYEYKNGQTVVHYDPRRGRKREKTGYEKFSVKAQNKAYGRFFTVISLVAILLVFAVCALVMLETENEDFKFAEPSSSSSSDSAFSSEQYGGFDAV